MMTMILLLKDKIKLLYKCHRLAAIFIVSAFSLALALKFNSSSTASTSVSIHDHISVVRVRLYITITLTTSCRRLMNLNYNDQNYNYIQSSSSLNEKKNQLHTRPNPLSSPLGEFNIGSCSRISASTPSPPPTPVSTAILASPSSRSAKSCNSGEQ